MFLFLAVFPSPSLTIPVVQSITHVSVENNCPPLPHPELAHCSDGVEKDYGGQIIPTGTLVLNIGPFAGQRQPGASKDGDERMHVFENAPGVFTVTGFGQSKDYGDATHPVNAGYGDAGIGKSRLLGAVGRKAEALGFGVSWGAVSPQDRTVPASSVPDMARTMVRQPAYVELGKDLLALLEQSGGGEPRSRRAVVLSSGDRIPDSFASPPLPASGAPQCAAGRRPAPPWSAPGWSTPPCSRSCRPG